ncbi:MAG: hypothetical protein ACJAYU_000815 [Bradymonadia bacterium]|jgi:hypothetical protein
MACAESSPPSSTDRDTTSDRDIEVVPDVEQDAADTNIGSDADASDASDTEEAVVPDADTAPDVDICPAGEDGCACDSGECVDELECIGGLCSGLECPPGSEGCVCVDGEFCDDDFICDDSECVDCEFGTLECPCDGSTCESGLICDGDSGDCREPETCGELACAPLQLCEVETSRCLPACELGFVWNASRSLCVPDVGSSCEPGVEGSLREECQVEGRECILVAGAARCGECLPWFFDFDGTCTPATCGDPATDPYSQVDDCAAIGRNCDASEDGAACGACFDGYIEDLEGPGCIPPRLCEELSCGDLNRDCDPDAGYARCTECVEGYVAEPGEDGCILFLECDELDCVPFSRECEFGVTAYCGACMVGWIENEAGLCECEATGGEPRQYWPDADGDGYGDPNGLGVCAPTAGHVGNDLDCDDTESAYAPGEPDSPDVLALDTNCDGTDGQIDRLIFVVPGASDDTADGSQELPYGSLEAALVAAEWAAADVDAVALSVGVHDGPLVASGGVAVWGGYDPADGWARRMSRETIVRTSFSSEAFAGLIAYEVAEQTMVAGIAFETTAHPEAGGTTYGAAVVRSPNLQLHNCSFAAGPAGNGNVGGSGASGTAGAGGSSGQNGGDSGNGGGGGANASCAPANGGNGGRGGGRNQYGGNGSPDGCGGDGGEDGRPWDNEGRPGSNGCSRTSVGPAGAAGAHSTTGGGPLGEWWVLSAAANGAAGLHGQGGGGGGGGGGPEILNYRGGGGGGGGAGGCGGAAGTAGGSGGSSIGLWLVDTEGLSAESIQVSANSGGAAGQGGGGGSGGPGMPGAGGGGRQGVGLSGSGVGGAGGAGAAGGPGGRGGDGAAGSSIGVYCIDTSWVPSGDSDVSSGAAGANLGAGPGGVSAIVVGCE